MKYWQRKKQERLYKQWTQHSELPPEAVPRFGEPAESGADAGLSEDTGGLGYTRPGRAFEPGEQGRLGMDARALVEDRGLWYRFRLLLVDVVRKILRVD